MWPARLLFLLIGLLVLSGCSSWHQVRVAPEIAPAINADAPVRATQASRPSVVLWHPRVVGDSLIGDVGYPPRRTAFALRDLRRLEVLKPSTPRTAGAVLVGIIAGFAWVFLHWLTGG